MAFTTLLMTVSMVAIASAGFPGWPDNDSPFLGFPPPMMSSLRFGPMVSPPSMPRMPTFPQNFPFFQQLPVFPTMPTILSMPSVADIVSRAPKNGGSFTGVVVSSKSESKRKEDGTIVKESGSTILTNTDGVISMKQTGNNPPKIPLPTNAPPFDFNDPKMKPSNPYQFKNINNFKKFGDFNNFGFRHTFPAIDPKEIETYVPGEGETFKGQSVRTHTFSTNNNGEVNEGGSSTRIDNDNGHVNKEKVYYSSDGTQS